MPRLRRKLPKTRLERSLRISDAPRSLGVRRPKGQAQTRFFFNEEIAVGQRAKAFEKFVFGTTYAGANVGHPSGSVRRLDLHGCWEHHDRRVDRNEPDHAL